MARPVPGNTVPDVSGMRPAEADTLERLAQGLPSDFTVYHNLYWTKAFSPAMAYGEVDFVVVAPDGRLLVIEQKNGPLVQTENGFAKYYGEPKAKSVDEQILRSVSALREKFAQQHPKQPGLFIDCLLYCPDEHVRHVRGSALDRARVVDADDRDHLADIVTARSKRGQTTIKAALVVDSGSNRNKAVLKEEFVRRSVTEAFSRSTLIDFQYPARSSTSPS